MFVAEAHARRKRFCARRGKAHSFLELETGCLHRRIERAMLTVIAAATETVPLCLRYSNMPSGSNAEQSDKEIAGEKQRDQMLKLVAKGFYNELANYGVRNHEIVQVASHLLDNLLATEKKPAEGVEYHNTMFTLASVRDEWVNRKQLGIQHVTLRPLELSDVSKVFVWMQVPAVSESFVPPFPRSQKELRKYFADGDTEIFRHLLQ